VAIKYHHFKGSSAIDSASYDTGTEELAIKFIGSRSYTYFNVPEDVYEAFIAAPSAGQFFRQRIKPTHSKW
jgi:hypothetical protein